MEIKCSDDILCNMLSDPKRREEGFRILMKKYGHALYWHIRRIVVSHDDAEDVFQEACIRIFRGLSHFNGDSSLLTWMYKIATNESLQHLRRQTRFYKSIDSMAETLTDCLMAESAYDADETEVIFQKALLTLPTQQRIAFNLKYYSNMSYADISTITGKNIGTLKTNYHYATEKIREYIKEHAR